MTTTPIKCNQPICYSFSSRWHRSLVNSRVKVFFRKVRPIREPEITFFYVGTPFKQIVGYAQIQKIERVNLEQAKSIQNDGAISEKELENYFGNTSHVHAIWISNHQIFEEPFDLGKLKSEFGIFAPQNFFNVAQDLNEFLMGEHR